MPGVSATDLQREYASEIACPALARFRQLYLLERQWKPLSDEERYLLRQEQALPILDELHQWLQSCSSRVLPKSKIGEAVSGAKKGDRRNTVRPGNINVSLLVLSTLLWLCAADFIYKLHGKWFPMPRETFNVVFYSFVGILQNLRVRLQYCAVGRLVDYWMKRTVARNWQQKRRRQG